jgi:hypothetical protein
VATSRSSEFRLAHGLSSPKMLTYSLIGTTSDRNAVQQPMSALCQKRTSPCLSFFRGLGRNYRAGRHYWRVTAGGFQSSYRAGRPLSGAREADRRRKHDERNRRQSSGDYRREQRAWRSCSATAVKRRREGRARRAAFGSPSSSPKIKYRQPASSCSVTHRHIHSEHPLQKLLTACGSSMAPGCLAAPRCRALAV